MRKILMLADIPNGSSIAVLGFHEDAPQFERELRAAVADVLLGQYLDEMVEHTVLLHTHSRYREDGMNPYVPRIASVISPANPVARMSRNGGYPVRCKTLILQVGDIRRP